MTAAIITHPACALHEHGAPYHVEIPERLEAIQTCFDEAGMDAMTTPYLSPQATREQLVRAHHPDLVMISAGFDSHAEDEMGNFQLQDEDYAWITAELCQIAADFAEGRVVSCLEGGYTLLPLGRAATAHIRVLANYSEN